MNAAKRRAAAASRASAVAALSLVVALALTLMAPAGPARAAAASGQEIAEALTCQCGCGLTVANCNHPNCSFSVPMRERIDAMLAQRMGRAQIIAYFRKQYGEKILSAPTTRGFNLLAWTMPFFALIVGGGLVVLMMGRWRRGAPAPASQASSDSPAREGGASGTSADPALRERLERELRERL